MDFKSFGDICSKFESDLILMITFNLCQVAKIPLYTSDSILKGIYHTTFRSLRRYELPVLSIRVLMTNSQMCRCVATFAFLQQSGHYFAVSALQLQ